MQQLSIFDYISPVHNIGDTLDPSRIGDPLTFCELVTMAGEVIAVRQDQKYQTVQILKSYRPDVGYENRRVLYDIGSHTCICMEENEYDGRMYRIRKGSVQMVHVSFDLVDSFYPRIPEQRTEGKVNEDQVTKRICISTSVLGALRGIPQAAEVLGGDGKTWASQSHPCLLPDRGSILPDRGTGPGSKLDL